jgi:hypothetical protein
MDSQNTHPGNVKETYRNDAFEYAPLSTTSNSIRLLKILPNLSDNGLIQCEMWQDTTDAEYTCLSYVWGAESNQQSLLINGKHFACRQNLWNFLHVARDQYAAESKIFWIDAICINQTSIRERNHQVSQMGDIHSKATDVLAWLGYEPEAIEFLRFLTRLVAERPQNEKDVRRIWYRESTKQLQHSYLQFEANTYWTRAWITQEILQARRFSILVNKEQIHALEFKVLAKLLPTLEKLGSKSGRKTEDLWRSRGRCFKMYVRVMAGYGLLVRLAAGWTDEIGRKLLDLLFLLGPRGCQIPRDRVYSLLAIADDSELVPVNYSLPEHVFVTSLLRSYNQSMCLCSLARLADSVDCVEPFTSLAPQSLLVQFSLTATELQVESRPTTALTPYGLEMLQKNPQRLVCSQCEDEILADPATELLFCLQQECNNNDVEGHFIVPKEKMNAPQSNDMFTLKLVARHKKGSPEYPRLFERHVSILAFGPEERTAEDFLLRLMEPPLCSIILPFESLVDVVLNVVDDDRRLCEKAENSMGGFHFLDHNSVGLA